MSNPNPRKYVPKLSTSDPHPTPTRHHRPRLTTPLRGPPPPRSADVSNAVTFVYYLPQDEALASGIGVDNGGLDAVESQAVVDVLNEELSWLLKLRPREFWTEVAKNDSLCKSLDSYLLFRNRWYDFPHRGAAGIVAGVIVGENELSRRVFMLFYRLSSNKDPGARAHDSLSIKDHTALLQDKRLLDMPKLLDICGIYGHENKELTSLLVNNAIKSQPFLVESFTTTCHNFINVADTMHQRCNTSVEVLVGSHGHQDHESKRFHEDLLEVMDFINDAVVSMDAFLDAYKPAALLFCQPIEIRCRQEDLLTVLRQLHDSLLPSLYQGFSLASKTENLNNGKHENIVRSLKLLSGRIAKFGWKLLETCYLSDEFIDEIFCQQAPKMFPIKVDDPVIRGDILVQMFRELSEKDFKQHAEIQSYGTFLQNIEKSYYILSRIDSLRSNGWIFMDEEQFHYISQIVEPLSFSRPQKESKLPPTSITPTNELKIDEDAVIMESRISQIKDLFPDYGKGFLSACLDVYNQNPEQVIQRILEGTLHDDLLCLDTTLEELPPRKPSSISTNSKGKGVLLEPETQKRRDKGKGLLLDSPIHVTQHSNTTEEKRVPVAPKIGRFTRKLKEDIADTEVLDSKAAKDSVRSTVLAAADNDNEYEDDYDDSFDDLGLSIVGSGTEEAEVSNDRISNLPGKSSSESQGSKNNSSWGTQKKPQFYVKDGKNYSYKVSGSVAVGNVQEAAIVNQTQKEMIHGLGRGGNIPIRTINRAQASEPANEESNPSDGGGRGNPNFRGRGGRRGGHRDRKNQAFRKHFAGLTGI